MINQKLPLPFPRCPDFELRCRECSTTTALEHKDDGKLCPACASANTETVAVDEYGDWDEYDQAEARAA